MGYPKGRPNSKKGKANKKGRSGVYVRTTEMKANMGIATSKRWADPKYRAMMIAAMKRGNDTPEARANHSAKSKRMWADPKKKEKIKANMRKPHQKEGADNGKKK